MSANEMTTKIEALRDLEELIEEKTGINTMTADDPLTVVATGTGKYIEFLGGSNDKSGREE